MLEAVIAFLQGCEHEHFKGLRLLSLSFKLFLTRKAAIPLIRVPMIVSDPGTAMVTIRLGANTDSWGLLSSVAKVLTTPVDEILLIV